MSDTGYKKNMKMKVWMTATICFFLTLAVSGQSASKDIEATTPDGKIVLLKADGTWSFKPVVKGKTLGVTKTAFAAIEEGMSYADVVTILGSAGEITSETHLFDTRTVSYSWKQAKGFGTMSVIFQNDNMQSKSQFGLK